MTSFPARTNPHTTEVNRTRGRPVSKREICRDYKMGWRTVDKILEHAEPPGYRLRMQRTQPKLALRDEAWLTASHSCGGDSVPGDAAVQQEP